MNQLLYAVDHYRGVGAGNVEQTFHAQHLVAVGMQQQRQPDTEHRPVDRIGQDQGEGADVTMDAGVGRCGAGCPHSQILRVVRGLEPTHHLATLGLDLEHIIAEQNLGVDAGLTGLDDLRDGIDLPQALEQSLDIVMSREIQLGQHQTVGQRRLLEALRIALEVVSAIDRIDRREDVADAEVVAQDAVMHHGGHHRDRVGQSGGLNDHAHERRDLTPFALVEALAALEGERLVSYAPRRGYSVSTVTPDMKDEIYTVRAAVEALAVRLAAQKADPATIAQLADILARARVAVERDETAVFGELDLAFHRTIWQASASPLVVRIAELVEGQIRLLVATGARAPGRMPIALAEHKRIYKAILGRKSADAEAAMLTHIKKSQETLLRAVPIGEEPAAGTGEPMDDARAASRATARKRSVARVTMK